MKIETKRCEECKDTKIIHEFPKNYTSRGGVGLYCKVCAKKRKRLPEIAVLWKNTPHNPRSGFR